MLPPISKLPESQQQYFWLEQFRTPAIINVVLNGVIAWFLFSSLERIPLWGGADADASIAPDLLITSILLPLLICLITTPIIVSHVRKGKVQTLPTELMSTTGLSQKPVLIRAVVLAVIGIVAAALPLIALLSIAGIEAMPAWQLIILKAVWAGALAAMVSPWIAWWAISDAASTETADASVR